MKKALILIVSLTLTFGTQAQVGRLVGGAVKKKLEQTVDKKVDAAFGVSRQGQAQSTEAPFKTKKTVENENRIPTPEEVMAMVPQFPTPQQLAEYACEQNRANPRTLKMITNPTTTFLANMVAASASGYVAMMGGSEVGSLYTFDEQLLKELDISEEKYNAMSEEDQHELATHYAAELQERYVRTAEVLASDDEYNKLMGQYTAIENEIEKMYSDNDSVCLEMWTKSFGTKVKPSEADVCSYFRLVVPMQYNVVVEVMKIRKSRQLPIAKEMDGYVQKLAKERPGEVYAGFYNQGGICATSYVGDAMRLTAISTPR